MATYATRQDVENIYGRDNVEQWADLNNKRDVSHIQSRIAWALQQAYDEINSRLKDGPYTIPFSVPYDGIIVDMEARLAGALLYDSRGLFPSNVDVQGRMADSPIETHKKKVDYYIRQIHGGQRKLLSQERQAISYPQAVDWDDE